LWGQKEYCDEEGLAVETGRGVFGEQSLVDTGQGQQGKLDLDQMEAVSST